MVCFVKKKYHIYIWYYYNGVVDPMEELGNLKNFFYLMKLIWKKKEINKYVYVVIANVFDHNVIITDGVKKWTTRWSNRKKL